MSRIELHCPSCGYDVPLTLLPPPKMFECPECQEVMPRDKLTRLKVLHRHIAGAPASTAMTATLLGSNSFYDAAAGTASLSVAGCVFEKGDIGIICTVNYLLASGGNTVSSVSFGGASGGSVSSNPSGDISVEIWSAQNLTAGNKTVSVSAWSSNPTAAAMVVLALKRGKTSAATDGSAGGVGTAGGLGPVYDTTATSALSLVSEMAVVAVGYDDADSIAAATFPSGWTPSGRSGTHHGGPPKDVCIDVAYNLRYDKSAVQVTGNTATILDVGAVVATFKPL